MITVADMSSEAIRKQVEQLFREYASNSQYQMCLKGFEVELAELQNDYSLPGNILFLVILDDKAVGCVAMRRGDEKSAEVRRLFIQPHYRGKGLGRQLLERLIAEAERAGCSRIRLDTLPVMTQAQALYQSFGFIVTSRPDCTCSEAAISMELRLN